MQAGRFGVELEEVTERLKRLFVAGHWLDRSDVDVDVDDGLRGNPGHCCRSDVFDAHRHVTERVV